MYPGKRVLDVIISGAALLALAPVMGVVAAAVRMSHGAPVVFSQLRPGLGGEPFRIYKFRTMRDEIGPDGRQLPDAERLNAIGRFLRATSLDELPGLVNVLRGEMSMVGPRPLLMEYLPLYSPRQSRRHEVKPGITGWAQVNGRNAICWEEKFELDVWYVENASFLLDLRILLLTIRKVLQREGITQSGQATAEIFRGN